MPGLNYHPLEILMTVFPLGEIVATPGAIAKFSSEFLATCLARHANGDWGKGAEAAANARALRDNDQILSVYNRDGATLWIITEHDRSVTTLLLPEEN